MDISLERFIETLDPVPTELQRNFSLMTELDQRTKSLVDKIRDDVACYRKSPRMSERNVLYKEIMVAFDKARDYADDKIRIAHQTYHLVDKHIRRLDGELARIDKECRDVSTSKSNETTKKQSVPIKTSSSPVVAPSAEQLAVDMPIDPNEPLYCTCHQVSHGEMIACDNKECPIEWFHFTCVNLVEKPKGRWYCNECYNNYKNKSSSKSSKKRRHHT